MKTFPLNILLGPKTYINRGFIQKFSEPFFHSIFPGAKIINSWDYEAKGRFPHGIKEDHKEIHLVIFGGHSYTYRPSDLRKKIQGIELFTDNIIACNELMGSLSPETFIVLYDKESGQNEFHDGYRHQRVYPFEEKDFITRIETNAVELFMNKLTNIRHALESMGWTEWMSQKA